MSECHSAELPILDISQPLQPSALASLAEACQEWGFFRISNHGISKELYNKLYSLSQQLFGLPAETKLELGPSSSINTYTPHFIASPFFECLRVLGPNFFASAQSSADTLFGQQSFEFRWYTNCNFLFFMRLYFLFFPDCFHIFCVLFFSFPFPSLQSGTTRIWDQDDRIIEENLGDFIDEFGGGF